MSDEKKKRGRPPKHGFKTKTGIRCDLFNGEKDELDRATDRVIDPKTNKPIPQSDLSRQAVLFAVREINNGQLPVWDERYGALAMFGEAAAGVPILNYDDPPDWKRLQDLFPSGQGLGLLKIRGKSMIDAGILDGDYVVVRKADTAEKGQRVVALVDSGLTVKKLDWEGRGDRRTYFLVPESTGHEPIKISGANDGRIVGVLVGVIRTY